jgi:sulfur carrier protein
MTAVTVNGVDRRVSEGTTVAGLDEIRGRPDGVAVAVNATVVRRTGWDTTVLHEGDRIDVLTAAQGG